MKQLYLILLFLIPATCFGQNFEDEWTGHFSYFNVKDVVSSSTKVYVAVENVLYTYDPVSDTIDTITTVQGLSGELISTLMYSETYQLVIVGYENGLLEIYDEVEEEVFRIIDILDKPTIPPENKRINHLNEFENLVFISTDFGISVYDLERLEFGDTYFIGNQGIQVRVRQTEVFNGFIYAASLDNAGLRRAPVDSDDLVDFAEWTQIVPGNFVGIERFNDRLYTVRLNKEIYEVQGANINLLDSYNLLPIKLQSSNNRLLVTTENEVFVYEDGFILTNTYIRNNNLYEGFTGSAVVGNNLFIGTQESGLINNDLSSAFPDESLIPTGILRNNVFSITASQGDVWASYGDYSLTYNPAPRRMYGLSRLRDAIWNNIQYDSIELAVGKRVDNLNIASINPNNRDQVFISSFQSGLLELNGLQPMIVYDQTNSGLESLFIPSAPSFVSVRVSGNTFDTNGLLWTITSKIDSPLKSYNPDSGQWTSYEFTSIIPSGLDDESGFSEIVIGPDGTKWIGGLENGLIGFNETGGQVQIRSIFDEEVANLPSTGVWSIAVDKRNQVWIGGNKGLRVLFNTGNFFDAPTVTTQPIIILEDGIPKELLEQQFISDIIVDGGNNKWVSTIGAGVFYFTPDGQETIYHFTKDNSPLPSNNINRMDLDESTGELYIATDKGVVSFSAGGSQPQNDLADVFVYPNPVRPGFDMEEKKIKIQDISDNCNIKITDIAGNLVAEAETNTNRRFNGYNLEIEGGTALWNGKNLVNNTVASGVYLVMISDLDTFETKVLKLMIVR